MPGLYARQGAEIVANTTRFDDQRRPTVVKLASGNFVVVWDDISRQGGDTDLDSVRAQMFDPNGRPIGGEFLVNSTTYRGQMDSKTAALANGGFVVTWTDYNVDGADNQSSSVKAQMFDSAGAKVGGELLVNSTIPGYQMYAAVSHLADGGFVAVWVDAQSLLSLQGNIRGQRYDSAGAKIGGEFTVNSMADNRQTSPHVTTLADGKFVVTWTDGTPGTLDGSGHSVRGQMFAADGARIGTEFQINESAYGNQQSQSVTALAGGGFLAIWVDQTGFPGSALFAAGGSTLEGQIFDSNGNRVGNEFLINPVRRTTQSGTTVAAMPDGTFVVSWNDLTYRDTSQAWSHIAAQAFDARGNRLGDQFYLESHQSIHDQTALAALDGGRFVAVWHGGTGSAFSNNYPGDIRTQIFAPARGVVDISLSTAQVSETQPNNLRIGTIAATSEAANTLVSYEIVADSTGGAFRIEGNRLVVADNSRLDYETGAAVTLTVRAHDGAGGHYDETLTLSLTDSAIERRWAAGEEVRVNTTISRDQEDPAVATFGGGHVVVWEDPDSGGDRYGPSIKAQLFGTDGARLGGEFRVNDPWGGQQYDPAAAELAGGGFVVGWTEYDPGSAAGYSVKAKIYDSTGKAIAGEFGEFFVQADPAQAGDQDRVAFAGTAAGGFAAAWHDQTGDGSSGAIKLRLFGATGEPLGGERVINTDTAGDQRDPAIATLAGGGFIVTWTDPAADPSRDGIKGQRLDSSGNPVGGEFAVADAAGASLGASAVKGLVGGGFVVVWQQSFGPVRAQLFDASGAKVGSEIAFERSIYQVADASRGPAVTALPDGGFMIAVKGDGGPGLDPLGILVQQFDSGGVPVGPAWMANGNIAGQQGAPALATLASGGIAAAWVEPVESPSSDGNGASISGRVFQPVDLRSQAFGDHFATDESTPVSGNVLADNGSGADTGSARVASINGDPAAVGQAITLASGALLTLNADGSFTYDPNGSFDSLVGPESGAANGSAADSFRYALDGGSSADVIVSVAGITAPGEPFLGGAGNDRITGTNGADLFKLDQGGDDYAYGNAGDDIFWFGAAMNWLDQVGGGEGEDRVLLQGDYYTHFGTGSLFEVERLVLLSGQDTSFGGGSPSSLYSYTLSLLTGLIASGRTLIVDGAGLGSGESANVTASSFMTGTLVAYGGQGDDSLTGGAGADTLEGAAGNDRLDGGWGADTMRGGAGNDTYFVDNEGDVVVENGGEGIDTVDTSLASFSLANLPNVERLTGTPVEQAAAMLQATADGEATAATLQAASVGETTAATLQAAPAAPVPGQSLTGNARDNLITAAGGNDFIYLWNAGGDDTVLAGAGNDNIFFGPTLTAADVLDGGEGTDTLVVQGPYGALTLTANIIQIENLSILGGNNMNFGEPGTNRYDYVVTVNDANFAAGVQARVNGAALLEGEDFTFDGSAETDAKFVVYGGKGKDTLTGGLGNDIFFYAEERFATGDTVNGGPGYDGMFLRGNYTIDFNAPGYTGLFTNIENLTLTSATDERYARGGGTEFDYNLILANAIVKPGETLTVSGALLMATETMILDASQEADGMLRLFGGRADDTLKGGGQADLLHGNLGADTLAGGGGADVFRYDSTAESNSASKDRILDFNPGADKIDLSRIDASTGAAGDQAFAWIGSAAFSGVAGQLRAVQSGGDWILQGDTNGDGVADLVVALTLQGPAPLGAGDFLL